MGVCGGAPGSLWGVDRGGISTRDRGLAILALFSYTEFRTKFSKEDVCQHLLSCRCLNSDNTAAQW